MGRRGGGYGNYRLPRGPAPPPPPAAQKDSSPAPASNGGGRSMFGGLGESIVEGMSFGTARAFAHRALDSVMGPRTIQHETVPSAAPANDACRMHLDAFTKCLNNSVNEINKCQFYMDTLSECRNSSGSMLNA